MFLPYISVHVCSEGEESVDDIIHKLRVGQRVRVSGRVQGQQNMTSNPRRDVIDFIVHHITFHNDRSEKKKKDKQQKAQVVAATTEQHQSASEKPGKADVAETRSTSPTSDDVQSGNAPMLQHIADNKIFLVDTVEKMSTIRAFFDTPAGTEEFPRILGLDAEWRPRALLQEGDAAPVCCIQISNGDKALIVDFVALLANAGGDDSMERYVMFTSLNVYACVYTYIYILTLNMQTCVYTYRYILTLNMYACMYTYIYKLTYIQKHTSRRTSEQLDAEFTALLFAPHTLLLGYSFESDVQKLIETFPHMKSLQALSQLVEEQANSFLDIQDLARAYLRLPRARPIGLSSACASVLGAGLNKTMQVLPARAHTCIPSLVCIWCICVEYRGLWVFWRVERGPEQICVWAFLVVVCAEVKLPRLQMYERTSSFLTCIFIDSLHVYS